MFKKYASNQSRHSDIEFIQEQLMNGNIKKYIKGRTLGKVTITSSREDSHSATNSSQKKPARDMLPKSSIKKPSTKEKPKKN